MAKRRGGLTMGDDSVLKWARKAPAERMSLPASCALWAAAECLHLGAVSGLETGLTSLAVAAVAFGAGKGGGPARQAATAAVLTGGWLTAADVAGPLAGHYYPLTITWGIGTLLGYRWLRKHEKVRSAREWRAAKADWLERRAPLYGLHGSHLLKYETTRLGDAMTVDVKGTGKRASSLVHGSLAEDIAETEMLAVSRVQVTLAGIAGRIRISIRRIDPWKDDILHPALGGASETVLPTPCTVREPLDVGMDPETGKPLRLAIWDKDGSKNVLIVGIKGSGKTDLLSCIRERVTAAEDALLFDINVSKALEDTEWSPACNLAAVGPAEKKRALYILRCANKVVVYRPTVTRDTPVVQPSRDRPLVVVMIDEINKLVQGNDHLTAAIKKELADLVSTDRSEAVAVIAAGQRGTAEYVGGADIRSQFDVFAIGKVGRRGEMNHAAGDMGMLMPDMASYGEGHAGVWVIAELGGDHHVGRTFRLTEPPDLREMAAGRAASQPELEPGLVAHLGEFYARLRAGDIVRTAQRTARTALYANGDKSDTAGPSPVITMDKPPIDVLDQEMEDMLPPELRDRLKRMDARNAETAEINAGTDAIMASLPEVDPAALAAHSRARWDDLGRQTEIPPDAREKLIMLLAQDGMSSRKITEAFAGPDGKLHRKEVSAWLHRLRVDGVARIDGKGRAARWVLTGDGDSS